MKYVLDTTICVFFLRGKMNMAEVLREKGRKNCYISEITVAELRYGAENSADIVKSNLAVDAFLNGLQIIPIFGCIHRYAKEKVRLRKLEHPMHDDFDLLIGVTAVENDMILVTDNIRHFQRLENIRIENWFEQY